MRRTRAIRGSRTPRSCGRRGGHGGSPVRLRASSPGTSTSIRPARAPAAGETDAVGSRPGGGGGHLTFEEARAEFPVLERYAYLNAGSVGPLARRTHEAMARAELAELEEGRAGLPYLHG